MLNLTPGVTLGDRQLAGIIHLVASSIPNLDASRVSVVDQGGKLLSDQGKDNDFGYTAEQFRIAQQLEKAMSERILDILEPLFGPGAVRAQVTADMDFTRIERTSETFDPETVLRSEQSTENIDNKLAGGASGVPGELTNQPPGAANINANPNPQPNQAPVIDNRPARESRKVTRNFEVNKNIAHVREVPGSLNRLSVAVVVDYVLDADGNKVALDQARIDQINQLVREAVGFDQARGDTLSVINSPFVAPAPIEPIPEPSILEQGWVWQAARGVGAAVALLLIFLMVVRPLIRYSTSYVPPSAARDDDEDQPRLAGPAGRDDEFGDDTVSIGGSGQRALPGASSSGANYHQNVAMARNVANEQPARAAYVVRNWIAADG
jgi:flagellar M-ring protein FliF